MRIDILSLFPEYFSGPFDQSMIKQARKKGILDIRLTDIRTFAEDKHQRVDERPYGGGPGMVMMAPPVIKALRSVNGNKDSFSNAEQKNLEGLSQKAHVVYVSPQGSPLNATKCKELASKKHLVFLCGHYEGVDQRVLDKEIDEEISIGDYVLTNGCLATIVIIDALVRFIPHVLGHEEAAIEDSFEWGLLDCPHYTRPEVFEGVQVPEILLSGDHKKIKEWRFVAKLEATRKKRRDLWIQYLARSQKDFLPKTKKNSKTGLLRAIKGENSANFTINAGINTPIDSNLKLTKLVLKVKNLKKSLIFYLSIFGVEVIYQTEKDAIIQEAVIRIGDQHIMLVEAKANLNSPTCTDSTCSIYLEVERKALEQGAIWVQQKLDPHDKRNVKVIVDDQQQISAIELIDPDGYTWVIAAI